MPQNFKIFLSLLVLLPAPLFAQNTGITVTPAGSVGIKTTIPTASLTVAKSGADSPQEGLIFVNNVFGDDDQWPEAAIYSAAYTGFNGGLIFATDGMGGSGVTERMRIDQNGNIGVGTSTPTSSLEVNGSIALTSGSGGAIIFPDGTRQFTAASSSGSGGAASVPSGISEVNGNVGIGTAAPVSLLTIGNPSGDGYAVPQDGIVFLDTVFGSSQTWSQAAIYSMGYTNFNGGLIFATDDTGGHGVTEKVRIDPSGNVGIGTSSPTQALEVAGSIKLDGSSHGIIFPDGTQLTTASGGSATTSSPTSFTIQGQGDSFTVSGANLDPRGIALSSLITPSSIGKVLEGWNYSGGNGEQDFFENRGSGAPGGFNFYDYSNGGVVTPLFAINGSGQVGIGTTTPGQGLQVQNSSGTLAPYTPQGSLLQISGTIALTTGAGGSILFPDGTVQSTAWNGTIVGGDYAESVDVRASDIAYEPGDVIAIDSAMPGRFDKSSIPYSRLVAGVYSTRPGLVGRRTTFPRADQSAEVPMAMMGIVPTKVSTENGPIEPGDLLVSSSKPGYAMKGTDSSRLQETVIGKALGAMASGVGIIEALLALQ